jgi:hypothetical protein
MKTKLATGAIVFLLASRVILAAAQTGGTTQPSMALELTAQQRADIYRTVAQHKLSTPPPANLPTTVGVEIPPATELYSLPEAITAQAPSAKFYRYTVAQNRVVIVDPTNLKVVDVIQP